MNKKLAAIPLLIAITLSIFGFVYAHWSDMVYIEGTVEMGTLAIAFDPVEPLIVWDNEDLLPIPKDIGKSTMEYDPTSYVVDEHTGKDGYKKLILEINDAYPCYEVHFVTVTIWNIGTIPAHIIDLIITGWDVTDNEELKFDWRIEFKDGYFWQDLNGNGVVDPDTEEMINVTIKNFVCTQIDPCSPGTKGEFDFHFKQPAEECHTYTFSITIEAIQWNKA
ncbi:MAG: hypothetical protein OEY88_05320 [Candidatus Bathyarchaeota archaeon]|nr:hypothetical protein [Candidatus Bathyarchaeota archaeon]